MKFVLCFFLLALPGWSQVKLTQQPDRISVQLDGQPFTDFFLGKDTPKPYLHPLRTAGGLRLTRNFPMEKTPGEPVDHEHHRGLWFTHGLVNGFNFWENEESYTTTNRGRIVLKSVDKLTNGQDSGSLTATFDWRDPTGQTLLTETRTMTFAKRPGDIRLIDVDVRFLPAKEVTFGDTKEGAFAIRLRPELDEKHTGKMVNDEGLATEKEVWGKKSAWVDYSGEVEGQKVGIAILDDPGNPGHPTRWHSRAYGLFAANPFGLKDFDKNAPGTGGLTFPAGKPVRFRYRVIIHPGDAQTAKIGLLYAEFQGK